MLKISKVYKNFHKLDKFPTKNRFIFVENYFNEFQHGISEWFSERQYDEQLDSVLDYAKRKYGEAFVEDVKALQGVVYVFLPLPIFWSLFDQQV